MHNACNTQWPPFDTCIWLGTGWNTSCSCKSLHCATTSGINKCVFNEFCVLVRRPRKYAFPPFFSPFSFLFSLLLLRFFLPPSCTWIKHNGLCYMACFWTTCQNEKRANIGVACLTKWQGPWTWSISGIPAMGQEHVCAQKGKEMLGRRILRRRNQWAKNSRISDA